MTCYRTGNIRPLLTYNDFFFCRSFSERFYFWSFKILLFFDLFVKDEYFQAFAKKHSFMTNKRKQRVSLGYPLSSFVCQN